MDHLRLLCDIGELNWIFSDRASSGIFLQRIVSLVASHMQADVCSVYLYDAGKEELVLTATKGLSPDSVDKVRLKLGEGLVGLAVREGRPVCEPVASVHPHFKFFPGIFEERYESFLVVPILRGQGKVGALTVQRAKESPFGDHDVLALRAVASQLANIIENARRLFTLQGRHGGEAEDLRAARFLRGKAASGGVAFGEAIVVDTERFLGQVLQLDVDKLYSLEDFQRALSVTERQLQHAQKLLEERFPEEVSLLLDSHLLMLRDQAFIGGMLELIERGESAPAAVLKTAKRYIDLFAQNENTYVREKAHDLKDLTLRLMWNLVSDRAELSLWRDRIVVARELFPSDVLQMASEGVKGLVLIGGGLTSHLALLIRSLGVPLVIVDQAQLLGLPEKTTVLLDADAGSVFVNPAPQVVADFQANARGRRTLETKSDSMRPVTLTKDGCRIRLLANINLVSDVRVARELRAEGIGLYRTELPFLVRGASPSEEEQVAVYRRVVEGLPGAPVTFRTLDIGGDKTLASVDTLPERNPALGFRSIRFCLANRPVFVRQLRAILRASVGADVRVMFPMISSLEEFLEARAVLRGCLEELRAEHIPHHDRVPIGMMVEVPAVAELMDALAEEAEFIALGTNDLIQYMLAVDRANERVSGLYVSHHPAVLRTIARVVHAARRRDREVSVCGDMAHEERYLPFLLGIGVRTLSVDAAYLPPVQRAVSALTVVGAEAVAREVLAQNTTSAIGEILDAHLNAVREA